MKIADLLIDARGPEIRHRTGIVAPDAFIYLRVDGEPGTTYFDAREYDVQKILLERAGTGVRIERLEPFLDAAKKRQGAGSVQERALLAILEASGIGTVRVSAQMPYGWIRVLQQAGVAIEMAEYAEERVRKTEPELECIREAQRKTEQAFAHARSLLAEGKISGDTIVRGGAVLTSEWMRAELTKFLLDLGMSCPEGMVVASAEQSARPHDMGEGPLRPNSFIIVDIFPRDDATGYFGDMTRTFVKGNATEAMAKQYEAVRSVQREIADTIAVGQRCADVYARTVEAFARLGYETSPERGFMHRTGHSLGLSVHEEPSLGGASEAVLSPGTVVTVEPGLYYPEIGGVRIEDIVVFHEDGTKENLNRFEKDFLIP